MKVLILEDNPSISETLELILQTHGHVSYCARNTEEALDALEKNWADAVLLDLTLENTSGEEVYRSIQDRFGRVPATAVTSAVHNGKERVRGLPGALFLPKPYSIEDLLSILARLTPAACA